MAENNERKLFGTDGIRGVANQHPMTPEVAFKLGGALVVQARERGRDRPVILVGKDTRISGYLFETSLAAGICAYGGDVLLTGPIPTPAVARLTTTLQADSGAMISASHNAFEDNGIKVFGPDGFKLDDSAEAQLEWLMSEVRNARYDRPMGALVGAARRVDRARDIYETCLKTAVPATLSFKGLRIVFDGAHGAAYASGPDVLADLGAEVETLGVAPNGTNINANVGATAPERCAALVREKRADVGIAVDGDADRAVFIDETGAVVDGDAILALCALDRLRTGRLQGKAMVATVMSNLGLERALEREGGRVERCAVGDRYVVEALRKSGLTFGGEQSGHLVFLEHATTGDGLMSALQMLAVILREDRPLSELAAGALERVPQVLLSEVMPARRPLDTLKLTQDAIHAAERALGADGRVLVRWSGTEPKLRVLVEGPSESSIKGFACDILTAAHADLRA